MDFEKFWVNWPKKVAKKKAEIAWKRLTDLEKREALEALPKLYSLPCQLDKRCTMGRCFRHDPRQRKGGQVLDV